MSHSPKPTESRLLFHYGGQGLLHALHDEEFVVTSATDFDDPFEFLPGVLPDDGTTKLGSLAEDIELVQEASSGIFYALCLSRKPNDVRMWAQYGDNHRGIMLTLDFFASEKTREWGEANWMLDVEYPPSNERHCVEWKPDNRVDLNPEQIKALFTIKGHDWKDQAETRLIVPNSYITKHSENGSFKIIEGRMRALLKLPQECVSKVTLGYRSSPRLQASIEKLREIKNATWAISKLDRHRSKFEFEEQIIHEGSKAARTKIAS